MSVVYSYLGKTKDEWLEELDFNFETGIVKRKNGSYRNVGRYDRTRGYYRFGCTINGKTRETALHRLIFFTYNGYINSKLQVDHIDRDRTNNKPDNLRLVTQKENNKNNGRLLGLLPVGVRKFGSKWESVVVHSSGKLLHYGVFDTIEEASQSYLDFKQRKIDIPTDINEVVDKTSAVGESRKCLRVCKNCRRN